MSGATTVDRLAGRAGGRRREWGTRQDRARRTVTGGSVYSGRRVASSMTSAVDPAGYPLSDSAIGSFIEGKLDATTITVRANDETTDHAAPESGRGEP